MMFRSGPRALWARDLVNNQVLLDLNGRKPDPKSRQWQQNQILERRMDRSDLLCEVFPDLFPICNNPDARVGEC